MYLEEIEVKNNQLRPINNEEALIRSLVDTDKGFYTVSGRLGTRFDIVLSKLSEKNYLVSIPNFYFSMTTPEPRNIAYKLVEREVMPAVDAETVEMIIKHMLEINQS